MLFASTYSREYSIATFTSVSHMNILDVGWWWAKPKTFPSLSMMHLRRFFQWGTKRNNYPLNRSIDSNGAQADPFK